MKKTLSPSRKQHVLQASRRQAGATLIEGLVALAVFSFGMLAIVGMLANYIGTAGDARYRVEAAQFAESIMSEMRVAEPSTLAAQYGSQSGAAYQRWAARVSSSLPLQGVSDDVLPLVIAVDAGVVTVNLFWLASAEISAQTLQAKTGTPHTYVATTFIDG